MCIWRPRSFSLHLVGTLYSLAFNSILFLPFMCMNSREGTTISSVFRVHLLFSRCCTQDWIYWVFSFHFVYTENACVARAHTHTNCVSFLSNCIIWWEAKNSLVSMNVYVFVYTLYCAVCTFHSRMFIFQSYSFYIWREKTVTKRNTHLLFLFFAVVCTVYSDLWCYCFGPDFVQLIYSVHRLWYLPAL